MKACTKCKTKLPLVAFYKSRTGSRSCCKGCERESAIERMRAYRAAGREDKTKRRQHWINYRKSGKENAERQRAGALVRQAVRSGKLKKPQCCERCGKKRQLQGHHDDYSKPLVVRWVCTGCHGIIHKRLGWT